MHPHIAITRSASPAPCADPQPAGGAQNRVKSGYKAAGGANQHGLSVAELVHVGFAISTPRTSSSPLARRWRERAGDHASRLCPNARFSSAASRSFVRAARNNAAKCARLVGQSAHGQSPRGKFGRVPKSEASHPRRQIMQRPLEERPRKARRQQEHPGADREREKQALDHAPCQSIFQIQHVVQDDQGARGPSAALLSGRASTCVLPSLSRRSTTKSSPCTSPRRRVRSSPVSNR